MILSYDHTTSYIQNSDTGTPKNKWKSCMHLQTPVYVHSGIFSVPLLFSSTVIS